MESMRSGKLTAIIMCVIAGMFCIPLAGNAYAEDQDASAGQTPGEAPDAASQQPSVTTPKDQIDLPKVEQPQEVYEIKKIDPNRIGAQTYYETFAGVRVPEKILKSPVLSVGQRVEIYQEPKPIDSYMIMAKEMQHIWSDFHGWRQNQIQMTPADYRSIVVPLFVRAYGTEFTVSDGNPEKSETKGQIKYTLDYRDVYKEYYPKFPDLKASRWLQHDILVITTGKINPIGWLYTSNVGYRYSNINHEQFDTLHNWYFHSAPRYRNTFYVNQALAPNPRCEFFGQGEFFKDNYYDQDWAYKPEHYLIAGELRLKSEDMKTSYTGRISYSIDRYYPFASKYEKYEIWARVGRDFNDRFSAYSMLKYAYGHTYTVDNAWWIANPVGATTPISAPFDVTALAITWESRAQYRIYDRLWIQGGLDYGVGLNMCDFDNIGWLAGLEYYAPGIIRVDFGVRGNHYYNIDDFLGTVYFKVYFFM